MRWSDIAEKFRDILVLAFFSEFVCRFSKHWYRQIQSDETEVCRERFYIDQLFYHRKSEYMCYCHRFAYFLQENSEFIDFFILQCLLYLNWHLFFKLQPETQTIIVLIFLCDFQKPLQILISNQKFINQISCKCAIWYVLSHTAQMSILWKDLLTKESV